MTDDLDLKTIEEVFAYNLRVFRGKRTQSEIADAAGISLRSYQELESGRIPQAPNRAAIAKVLNAPETALFLDPDLQSKKGMSPSPEALKQLLGILSALDDSQTQKVLAFAKSLGGGSLPVDPGPPRPIPDSGNKGSDVS